MELEREKWVRVGPDVEVCERPGAPRPTEDEVAAERLNLAAQIERRLVERAES